MNEELLDLIEALISKWDSDLETFEEDSEDAVIETMNELSTLWFHLKTHGIV